MKTRTCVLLGKGDVGFECTGSGLAPGRMFPIVRPQGPIITVGVSRDLHFPFSAHRFHAEYFVAARMIAERRIEVRPISTSTSPMGHIRDAFDVVRDRSSQMKVQLSFAT
jgi:L-idonate 5-dehydrogenase